MNESAARFDDIRRRAETALAETGVPVEAGDVYLVRDVFGRVRVCVSDRIKPEPGSEKTLNRLAVRLSEALGPHGYSPDSGVLFMSPAMLKTFGDARSPVGDFDRVWWVERLVTGRDWWTVGEPRPEPGPQRWTLYSIKGGVGRSTTVAVLARRLAEKGERVLVVDLDLESPGISSAMLAPETRPALGVADWFVEELVGQGNRAIGRMTAAPEWARDLEGEAWVAPAHGAKPGEYLAKLGRVYMDTRDDPWAKRLRRMIDSLEEARSPTVVLIESRNGLHDIAAATVTDIEANVLLFATDSKSCWMDYDILFGHWRDRGLAARICERLSIVSALTPADEEEEAYLRRFRQNAWELFGNGLYDEVAPSTGPEDRFRPDLNEEGAPHDPLRIYWTRGLATVASLDRLDEAAMSQAYSVFLKRFDRLSESSGG